MALLQKSGEVENKNGYDLEYYSLTNFNHFIMPSDPKKSPLFFNVYIYCFNQDVSNLFAVEDPLIYVLLLVKISN